MPVIRVPKTVAMLLAGVAMVTAGCTAAGAASTPTPTPTPAASNPNSILITALAKGATVKSFHVASTIDGTIKVSALAAMMGRTSSFDGDVNLNGSTAQADVDVAGRAAHLTFTVPNFGTKVDLIVLNRVLYYRVSLLGTKYHVVDLSGLPRKSNPAASSAQATRLLGALAQARQKFEAAGGKITDAGVDQVAGKSAEHLRFTIPVAFLNQLIAAHRHGAPSGQRPAGAAGSMGAMGGLPPFTLDSASFDAWFYADGGLLARTELKAASPQLGNVDTVSTFTGYNAAATVQAPPSDQIQIGPSSAPGTLAP